MTTVNRRLYTIDPEELKGRDLGADDYQPEDTTRREVTDPDDALLVGSRLVNSDLHAPAIDLDVPARLIPSSTPGHFHLYIDVPMSWEQYDTVLSALAFAGVVEDGYVNASRSREQSFLRRPGVTK